MKALIPQSIKNLYHLFLAVIANIYFGFPSKKIIVIGITGTNGKTTTTKMVAAILKQAGRKIAMSSTIDFVINDKSWTNKTKFTTRSAWQTQKFIRQAVDAGCEYLILETSSHSLDQGRVWGVEYDVAVITNVTREHLDYHKDMARYRRAKLRLFEKLAKSYSKSSVLKTSIVNLDMEDPGEFMAPRANVRYGYTTTGHREGRAEVIAAQKIEMKPSGASFEVDGQKIDLKLVGRFNVENALAALAVAKALGVDFSAAKKALEGIKKVPGRMDYVENKKGIDIIIDYALTPDSMMKLVELIGEFKSGEKRRVIWVFGSCGERDRGKRPIMGAIGAMGADFVVITNEDPYGENPKRIVDEVFQGVVDPEKYLGGKKIKGKKEGVDAWRIMERKEAIEMAIGMAQKGDIILVTGKGAEETMAVGDKVIPWNDRNVIEKILSSYKAKEKEREEKK